LTSSRAYVDPVLSVHVGQFKTDVVRVVVELARQTPYTIRAESHIILVTFDSVHRQPQSPETDSKHEDAAASPVEEPADQLALAPVPAVPDKPFVAEHVVAPAAVFTSAELLPQYPLATTAAAAQPSPKMPSEPAGIAKTATAPGVLAGKLEPILPSNDYVIGPQDLLAINVWREPELSQTVPVRPDGKISFPLVGDLEVSGLTPRALQARLAQELDAYIHKAQVTVIVREVNSRKFYMIGEVERPGAYPLTPNMTVLDALATAGGFRDFAKVQHTYLLRLRPDGSRKRIRFDFKAAVNGKASYPDIELQVGDTLVVP